MTIELEPLLGPMSRFVMACAASLPDAVAADARGRILDVVGNALAARGEETATTVSQVAELLGGVAEATSLMTLGRLPSPNAALVAGTLAHALDFDDTHLRSVLHPSSSVVPAALALAEARAVSGQLVLAAVAAGLEVTVRLGIAGIDGTGRNSAWFQRGFHATSICGAVGAAAAGAIVLGLDEASAGHAMAVAASMGAGIIEANRTGGTVKRIHAGWAAHAGTMAALLAEAGLTGPPTVFEGRFGFLRAHLGRDLDPAALRDGLGDRWHALDTVYKPYPANHFTHAAIDAGLAVALNGVDLEAINELELGVPEPTLATIAQPETEKAAPRNGYAARFSGPFAVATGLVVGARERGRPEGPFVTLDDFSNNMVDDPVRLGLAARVRCIADEQATAAFPDRFGAVLRIRLTSGERVEERVLSSRGGPGNPLGDDALRQKFQNNLAYVGLGASAEQIARSVAALGETTRGTTAADLTAAIAAGIRGSVERK